MIGGKLRGEKNHANVFGTDSLGSKIGHQSGIQTAGKANDGVFEAHLLEVVAHANHQCVVNQGHLFRDGQAVFGGAIN